MNSFLDAASLLHYLQQVNEIARSLSGQPNAAAMSRLATEALVQQFDCAFARVWLVEPDQASLRLVASSGLYTHIDGSFAQVPMGQYKVGKIAQNRIPFLSNHLANETWVKDRQWALDNNIQGFAGYPLVTDTLVIGVLACFSCEPFDPEFLEMLQVLCMTLTVALHGALQSAHSRTASPAANLALSHLPIAGIPLSEQLARMLTKTQVTLVGTERSLRRACAGVLLQAAAVLCELNCSYCRLTYTPTTVKLDAVVIALVPPDKSHPGPSRNPDTVSMQADLADLMQIVTSCGGTLQTQTAMADKACQVSLVLPAVASPDAVITVYIHCPSPLLRQGMTQLAYQAGFRVTDAVSLADVLITDQQKSPETMPTLWLRHTHNAAAVPTAMNAVIDFTTTPEQLRQLVHQAAQGETVPTVNPELGLSTREQQVMQLLAAGKRDRDIAQALFISESTVKFHINNSLGKLQAKNRYQGVHQATLRGWI